MSQETLEGKVQEAIGRELENHPELKKSLLETIHDPAKNDAQKVAAIAQNVYALAGGFFTLCYDHLILELMIESGFTDTQGVERKIEISTSAEKPAVVDGVLAIPTSVWESMTLQGEEVKDLLGRYCLGLQVSNKLAQKHAQAVNLRLRAEMTAYSDAMNKRFYSMSEEELRALALTISELSYKFINPLCENLCTEEQYAQMYDMAYETIVQSMDEPNDLPLIRAFNEAAPNALFLDDRAGRILSIFRGLAETVRQNPQLKETFPLDFMSYTMTLVRF